MIKNLRTWNSLGQELKILQCLDILIIENHRECYVSQSRIEGTSIGLKEYALYKPRGLAWAWVSLMNFLWWMAQLSHGGLNLMQFSFNCLKHKMELMPPTSQDYCYTGYKVLGTIAEMGLEIWSLFLKMILHSTSDRISIRGNVVQHFSRKTIGFFEIIDI